MPGRLEVMTMADGSSGVVYLDLVVRGANIRKQVDGMMNAVRDSIRKPLDAVEKSTQASMERVAAQAASGAKKAAESAGKAVENSLGGSFSRAVAMANIKVQELEREYARLDEAYKAAISKPDSDKGDKAAQVLGAQRERMYDRLEAARDRLAVEVQAAAQKEADAEQAAADKAAAAAERAKAKEEATAQRAAATAEREAAKKEAAERRAADKAAAAQEAATKKTEEAHRKAAEATKQKWKKALGTLGKGLASPLTGVARKIGGVFKRGFSSAEKHAGHFKSRLKSIVSGALIFNGISAGLRSLTQYFSSAIGQTSEMQSALANLRGAAATAAAPLIQALAPALAALANVAARVFASIAQVVSLLTGKSVASMASAAKGMKSAGNAAGGAAKQMEKAQRTMAGFDEIETLAAPDTGGDSGGGGGAGGTDANYDAALDLDTSPISEKLAGIFDVFKAAWDSQGEKVIASMKGAFTSVKALAGSIGDSFYEVFTNGTGQQTLESILSIFGNIMGCVDKLADRLKVAWEDNGNGTAIIQAWWNGLNDILGMFDRMSGATVEWLSGLDLSPVMGSFAQYISVCESLIGLITGALADAYESVLLPLASWTIEDYVPACIDLLATAFQALCNILDPVWQGLKKLLDQLKPVADFIGDVVIDCLNGLKEIFAKVAETFQEKGDKIQGIISGVGEVIAVVWNAVRPIFELLRSIVSSVFTFIGNLIGNVVGAAIDALHGLIDFIAGIFTGDWDRAWNGIKEIFAGIWDGIKGIATSVWNFLKDIWNKVKDDVINIWNGIKSTIVNVVNGIKTDVSSAFNAVKTAITNVMNSIKSKVSGIWNGIVSTIKGAINGIIGGINGMIRGIANGINTVIRALNKLHFSIPDWVPALGGKSFGFNIKEVSAPQIPLLAKGGVIKQPTLAMMGEYPGAGSNPEIAAPQSAITEAVAAANGDVVDAILQVAKEIIDAIQENGGVTIGDEMLGRAVDRYNRKRAVINGGFA